MIDRQTEVKIMEAIMDGESWEYMREQFGVSNTVIRRLKKSGLEGGKRQRKPLLATEPGTKNVSTSFSENNGKVDIATSHEKGKVPRWLDVKNPEQLLRNCDIDTSAWEVISCNVTSSEVTMKLRTSVGRTRTDVPRTYTNVHVTVHLRKKNIGQQAIERLCDRLLNGPYKPKTFQKPRVRKDSVLLEWCPYDQHHGMLAWGPEVDESYDLKISEAFFEEAVNKVIQTASSFHIGQIVVPVGQDWFHTNDPTNQTPFAKHQLDVEGRLLKVFETGYWALFRAIERLRQMAPVHLLWVPGNHDPETSYYLVRALAAHYMDLDGGYRQGVTVDFTPRSRKVYCWGSSCIGFSHPISRGAWEKQRGIFSEVFKHEWAEAKFHEIHTGHLHKAMEYEFMQADTLGSHTVIRMLPSLCATDKWHWEMGFVEKNRASASFIWSKDEGLVCQFTTRVEDNRG